MAALLAGISFSTEVYKWVDERGAIHYGERPPANRPSQIVDIIPGPVIERGGQSNRKSEVEKQPAGRVTGVAMAPAAPGPPGASARGMEFDVFIRLQHGMTEGELLLRAGSPDHESLESIHHDIVKTYYYFPTVGSPYTTVITLRGGRIHEMDRVKKF
jgi:hypothetical protein